MKTLIKSLAQKSLLLTALATMAITTTSMAFSTTPVEKIYEVKDFKKIIVTGNVEVLLVQSNKESISYQDESTGKAEVTLQGNTLKIKSASNQISKIILNVKDIYRLDVSGNANVKTENTLNSKFLQIYVSDDAKADVSSRTEGLYTVVKDNADLRLDGNTENHVSTVNSLAKINSKKLMAQSTTFDTTTYVAKL